MFYSFLSFLPELFGVEVHLSEFLRQDVHTPHVTEQGRSTAVEGQEGCPNAPPSTDEQSRKI